MRYSDLHEAKRDVPDEKKTRLRRVLQRYRELLELLPEIREKCSKEFRATIIPKVEKDLASIKAYLQSYHYYLNNEENDDIRWLLDRNGMEYIKFWLEGWTMSARSFKDYAPALRAFRVVGRMFPNPPMRLWRVVAVPEGMTQPVKQMRTGVRSLQSWTTSYESAKVFYNKQYHIILRSCVRILMGLSIMRIQQKHDGVLSVPTFPLIGYCGHQNQ